MTKIPNLFNQNPLVISQGTHTQGWGTNSKSVAIDFAYTGDLICPFDGCFIELHKNSDQGRQSYFSLILPDNSRIICVHGYPVKVGTVNKGEVVGKCRWHHWHLSIIVNGDLDCILSYLDRSVAMHTHPTLYAGIGGANHPDGKWETYPDKYLTIGGTSPKPIYEWNVKVGDTLSSIVMEYYNLRNWQDIKKKVDEIAKFNNITNPNLIHINQKIKLN